MCFENALDCESLEITLYCLLHSQTQFVLCCRYNTLKMYCTLSDHPSHDTIWVLLDHKSHPSSLNMSILFPTLTSSWKSQLLFLTVPQPLSLCFKIMEEFMAVAVDRLQKMFMGRDTLAKWVTRHSERGVCKERSLLDIAEYYQGWGQTSTNWLITLSVFIRNILYNAKLLSSMHI